MDSLRTTRRAALMGLAGSAALPLLGATSAQAGGYGGLPRLIPQPGPGRYPTDPRTPKHQLRGMWIASVVNIDWPKATGLSAAEQKKQLTDWLDFAAASGFNAVYLQVRPTADAFWPSRIEPWSQYLTGVQGKDPGWDPLGTAVKEAHARNLRLHAWFNPYRVSMKDDPSLLSPEHPARRHPDWVIPYGGKLYFDPGNPEVVRHCVSAVLDAVRRYDLDGVHFDDYFYPYPVAGETFDDSASYARHGNGRDRGQWQRDNVDEFVQQMGRAIKRIKPWVQYGFSPFGIWRNSSTDPDLGSATQGGVQTYDDLGADTRGWVKKEWIDYIAPQLYWSRGFTVADYTVLTKWWADVVEGTQVQLLIGEAVYKVGANSDPNWNKPEELSSHLELGSQYPGLVDGNIYYNSTTTKADPLGSISRVKSDWYTRPALVPVLERASRPPLPVIDLRLRGNTLSWCNLSGNATTFAIYRVPGSRPGSADLADARHLVATVAATGRIGARQSWTDPSPTAEKASYVVSAVDRNGNESPGLTPR